MGVYVLVNKENDRLMGIPRIKGPLYFSTFEEAQKRCQEVNEFGIYGFPYSPEEVDDPEDY